MSRITYVVVGPGDYTTAGAEGEIAPVEASMIRSRARLLPGRLCATLAPTYDLA